MTRNGTDSGAEQPPAPGRVLVTGAAGLLGRVTARHFADRGSAVTALVLEDPGDLAGIGADRVVVGDAGDPEPVAAALDGVDAVVHLAAHPTPKHASAVEVFAGNSRATFNVLEQAGLRGVRRAMIASSLSILGIPWARRTLHPAYVPVDVDTPLQIEDPYALSKQADEATGAMMARRHGMGVVAVRYPFLSDAARAANRIPVIAADPAEAAPELWTYLDVRDAAHVAWLAVTVALEGFHTVFAAAPDTLSPRPTAELLAEFHPDAQIRAPLPGRTAPIDVLAAERLLGFKAGYLAEVGARNTPDPAGIAVVSEI